MSKRETYYCDRCGLEIDTEIKEHPAIFRPGGGGFQDSGPHYCRGCIGDVPLEVVRMALDELEGNHCGSSDAAEACRLLIRSYEEEA